MPTCGKPAPQRFHMRSMARDPTLRAPLARRGVLINAVAKLDGTKAVIDASFECKKHFDRLAEIDPDAALARHFQGMWHFEAANVGWFAKKAAAAFFGVPPEGSFEDARDHFLKAETVYKERTGVPWQYAKNKLFLVKTYIELKKKDSAREWLQKLLDQKAETTESKQIQEAGQKLLDGL